MRAWSKVDGGTNDDVPNDDGPNESCRVCRVGRCAGKANPVGAENVGGVEPPVFCGVISTLPLLSLRFFTIGGEFTLDSPLDWGGLVVGGIRRARSSTAECKSHASRAINRMARVVHASD